MNPYSTWVPIGHAAEIIGVHPETLRRWEAAGRLADIRVNRTLGNRRRFLRVDVERFARQMDSAGYSTPPEPTDPYYQTTTGHATPPEPTDPDYQ